MARSFLQIVEDHLQAGRGLECVWRPAADVYRTRDGWLVKFDLAGVDPSEIRVSLGGGRLTIAGVRRDLLVQEGCSSYSLEISYSRFERSLDLPLDTQSMQLRTEYRDGMLLVWLQENEKKQAL
jgi:HSP20 family protein